MLAKPSREIVLKKLRDCFPDAEVAADAMTILDMCGNYEPERVQLAILMQSQGDMERLLQLTIAAESDYRDVLAGAEFSGECDSPRDAPPDELAAIRSQDRAHYEAWVRSDRA